MQQLIGRLPILIAVLGLGFLAREGVSRLAPTWDPAVEPYVAFVEETRQLEFLSPVTVVRADIGDALSAINTENQADDGPDELAYDPYAEVTRLLGLTGPIENLQEAQNDIQESSSAAFYDPSTQTIVLPAGPVNPVMELTIVHELTHALQDQHGLLAYTSAESWTSGDLRNALIEGDAQLIEYAWYDALPDSAREELDAMLWSGSPPDGFLESSFGAPYSLGAPVVESVLADGGYDALNRLLRLKSLGSDERLLDPLSPSSVPKFDAESLIVDPDGNQWFDGWLGAFAWYHAIAPGAGAETALTAIQGYDNDVYVVFERDDQVCARFDIWFDTGNDAQQFSDAIAGWSVDLKIIINPSRTTVRLDVCEPVGDPADQVSELLTPLVVHNWLIVQHQGATDARAVIRCAATTQAGRYGFVEGESIDWAQLGAEAASAREACGGEADA